MAQNQLWCEITALVCELIAWTQLIALAGQARRWEPRRLRLRIFAVAERWPWAGEITAASARLQALPAV